jgi:hypothetical protein
MAPSNSSYSKRHDLDILQLFENVLFENDLRNFLNYGPVLIMGDTNARTGVEYELLDFSAIQRYVPMPSNIESNHSFIKRNSQDKTCCSRGREQLDLCISCNIQILNGRTIGDLSGKLTSFQYNENSVVDYWLV